MEAKKQLIQILNDTNSFLKDITALQNKKVDYVIKNNIAGVEECMKNEQAMILKLKGLDKKREQLQKSLGFENMSFREIIDKLPSEEKEEFKKLFDEMQNSLEVYRHTSKTAQNAIEINLHRLDSYLKELDENKKSGIYNESRNVSKNENSFKSRRV